MRALIGGGGILMIQGVSEIPNGSVVLEVVKLVLQAVIGVPTAVHVANPLVKQVIDFFKKRKERKNNPKNA